MYNDIVTAITTVGFPIVCCIGMYYYMVTCNKELTTAINNMNDSLIKILEHIKIEED